MNIQDKAASDLPYAIRKGENHWYTFKNAGLNTTQCWVKYGQTQLLGCFDPAVVLNVYPNQRL